MPSTLTQNEFDAILADASKVIEGNIEWSDDEDHSPSVEFKVQVVNATGYPLFVKGSYNRIARTLSYTVIHQAVGRIYGLDMGKGHRNPNRTVVGRVHKHRWSEQFRDADAYEPPDITAPVEDPTAVWGQFCAEANIRHNGALAGPPPLQEVLL